MFGLLLVLLLGKLVPYTDTPGHSYPHRVRGWLARWAVEGIAAIGWLVDRVYPQERAEKPESGSRTLSSTS